MTFRTLVIPVLRRVRPVQHIAMIDLLARIQVEPPLAALLLRARIPGDAERLQSPIGEWNQILLQRLDTECVGHLEIRELAVRAIGANVVMAIAREEGGLDAIFHHARVVEISEHRGRRGGLHGERMVRMSPELGFLRVAGCAFLTTHKGRSDLGRRSIPAFLFTAAITARNDEK